MHTGHHHTLSSLLASAIVLSYVRCNVCSAPSQASACPSKMFHIPCPVLVLVFLSLYIFVRVISLGHCYRNPRVFCRHPSRDWWSTIVSFCTTPSLLFTFIPLDCLYRVRFGIQLKRRLVGCLVRFFWRHYGFYSPISSIRYE